MKTTHFLAGAWVVLPALALAACSDSLIAPVPPTSPSVSSANAQDKRAWGPETPHFNLQVILRGDKQRDSRADDSAAAGKGSITN